MTQLRIEITGLQGSGKSLLANEISFLEMFQGKSILIQDEEPFMQRLLAPPADIVIICKQEDPDA